MAALRLLSFDGRGVLFELADRIGVIYARTADIYGIKADPDRLNKAFRTQWTEMNQEQPNFGVGAGKTSQQWWSELVNRTFRSALRSEEDISINDLAPEGAIRLTAAHLFKQFSTGDCWRVKNKAETLDTLDWLRKSKPNLKLCILSNTDERLDKILFQLGLRHYFELVIASAQVGVAKPDSKIFKLVQSKAHIDDPKQCLHVGDNYELDYLGAKGASWQAVLIGDQNGSDKADPKDIIVSLSKLKERL